VAWPTVGMAGIGLWGDAGLAGARAVYDEIARLIARHEPVTTVAAPADAEAAATECGPTVDVVALPIDDSWMRDTGPIVVVAGDGSRHALHFRFNAWGEKWAPWDADAAVSAAIAEDDGTDGHVDNVVAFTGPGRALLQGCADPENPNHAISGDNRRRLDAAGIAVTEIPVLPYARFASGRRMPVPYVNLYA